MFPDLYFVCLIVVFYLCTLFFPWFCGFIVKCFRDGPMYVLERYINKYYYYYYYYYYYLLQSGFCSCSATAYVWMYVMICVEANFPPASARVTSAHVWTYLKTGSSWGNAYPFKHIESLVDIFVTDGLYSILIWYNIPPYHNENPLYVGFMLQPATRTSSQMHMKYQHT